MLYLVTNDQRKNFSMHPHASRQLIMPRHWGLRQWGNYLTDSANYDSGRGNKVSLLLGLRLFCNSNHHALTLQRCQKLKERLTDKTTQGTQNIFLYKNIISCCSPDIKTKENSWLRQRVWVQFPASAIDGSQLPVIPVSSFRGSNSLF